jgi:hypothetical protein
VPSAKRQAIPVLRWKSATARAAWREMLRERMAEMVADRLLLQEDANRVLAAAGDAWEIFTSV